MTSSPLPQGAGQGEGVQETVALAEGWDVSSATLLDEAPADIGDQVGLHRLAGRRRVDPPLPSLATPLPRIAGPFHGGPKAAVTEALGRSPLATVRGAAVARSRVPAAPTMNAIL